MRVAKDQDLAVFVDDRFEILEIHFISAVYHFQRVVNDFAVHAFGNNTERVVNRRLDDYFVARPGETLQNETDSLYDTGDITEPFSSDFPVMLVVDPLDDAIVVGIRIERVSENFMLAAFF